MGELPGAGPGGTLCGAVAGKRGVAFCFRLRRLGVGGGAAPGHANHRRRCLLSTGPGRHGVYVRPRAGGLGCGALAAACFGGRGNRAGERIIERRTARNKKGCLYQGIRAWRPDRAGGVACLRIAGASGGARSFGRQGPSLRRRGASLLCFCAGFCGGRAVRAGKSICRECGWVASRFYTADFFGASLGALLASTLLLPLAGVTGVCVITGGLNLLAVLVFLRQRSFG